MNFESNIDSLKYRLIFDASTLLNIYYYYIIIIKIIVSK